MHAIIARYISRLCGDIRTQKERITGGIRKNIIPGKQFLTEILMLRRLTTYQDNYTNKIVAIKKSTLVRLVLIGNCMVITTGLFNEFAVI